MASKPAQQMVLVRPATAVTAKIAGTDSQPARTEVIPSDVSVAPPAATTGPGPAQIATAIRIIDLLDINTVEETYRVRRYLAPISPTLCTSSVPDPLSPSRPPQNSRTPTRPHPQKVTFEIRQRWLAPDSEDGHTLADGKCRHTPVPSMHIYIPPTHLTTLCVRPTCGNPTADCDCRTGLTV